MDETGQIVFWGLVFIFALTVIEGIFRDPHDRP